MGGHRAQKVCHITSIFRMWHSAGVLGLQEGFPFGQASAAVFCKASECSVLTQL